MVLDEGSGKRCLYFSDECLMHDAERPHRVDQKKFYRTLFFYSLEGLRKQGKSWNARCNDMRRMPLKLKAPNQVELQSLKRIMDNTGEARCLMFFKHFTSTDN